MGRGGYHSWLAAAISRLGWGVLGAGRGRKKKPRREAWAKSLERGTLVGNPLQEFLIEPHRQPRADVGWAVRGDKLKIKNYLFNLFSRGSAF